MTREPMTREQRELVKRALNARRRYRLRAYERIERELEALATGHPIHVKPPRRAAA